MEQPNRKITDGRRCKNNLAFQFLCATKDYNSCTESTSKGEKLYD
jgi:hypothetical protein